MFTNVVSHMFSHSIQFNFFFLFTRSRLFETRSYGNIAISHFKTNWKKFKIDETFIRLSCTAPKFPFSKLFFSALFCIQFCFFYPRKKGDECVEGETSLRLHFAFEILLIIHMTLKHSTQSFIKLRFMVIYKAKHTKVNNVDDDERRTTPRRKKSR